MRIVLVNIMHDLHALYSTARLTQPPAPLGAEHVRLRPGWTAAGDDGFVLHGESNG